MSTVKPHKSIPSRRIVVNTNSNRQRPAIGDDILSEPTNSATPELPAAGRAVYKTIGSTQVAKIGPNGIPEHTVYIGREHNKTYLSAVQAWRTEHPGQPLPAGLIGDWGNPYPMAEYNNDRAQVMRLYITGEKGILDDPDRLTRIRNGELKKDLICFCRPCACHGDVLKILSELPNSELDRLIDGEDRHLPARLENYLNALEKAGNTFNATAWFENEQRQPIGLDKQSAYQALLAYRDGHDDDMLSNVLSDPQTHQWASEALEKGLLGLSPADNRAIAQLLNIAAPERRIEGQANDGKLKQALQRQAEFSTPASFSTEGATSQVARDLIDNRLVEYDALGRHIRLPNEKAELAALRDSREYKANLNSRQLSVSDLLTLASSNQPLEQTRHHLLRAELEELAALDLKKQPDRETLDSLVSEARTFAEQKKPLADFETLTAREQLAVRQQLLRAQPDYRSACFAISQDKKARVGQNFLSPAEQKALTLEIERLLAEDQNVGYQPTFDAAGRSIGQPELTSAQDGAAHSERAERLRDTDAYKASLSRLLHPDLDQPYPSEQMPLLTAETRELARRERSQPDLMQADQTLLEQADQRISDPAAAADQRYLTELEQTADRRDWLRAQTSLYASARETVRIERNELHMHLIESGNVTIVTKKTDFGNAVHPFLTEQMLGNRRWAIVSVAIGAESLIFDNPASGSYDGGLITEAEMKGMSELRWLAQSGQRPTLAWPKDGKLECIYVEGLDRESFLASVGLRLGRVDRPQVLGKRLSRLMKPNDMHHTFKADQIELGILGQGQYTAEKLGFSDAAQLNKTWDGGGIINRRVLLAMPAPEGLSETDLAAWKKRQLYGNRFEFTVMTPQGQYKGHAVISDDDNGPDFLLPDDPKGEIALRADNPNLYIALSEVHGHNSTGLDVQSMINNLPYFGKEHLKQATRNSAAEFVDALTSGRTADLMQHLGDEQNDRFVPAAIARRGGQLTDYSGVVGQAIRGHLTSLKATEEGKLKITLPGACADYVLAASIARTAGYTVSCGDYEVQWVRGIGMIIGDKAWGEAMPDSPLLGQWETIPLNPGMSADYHHADLLRLTQWPTLDEQEQQWAAAELHWLADMRGLKTKASTPAEYLSLANQLDRWDRENTQQERWYRQPILDNAQRQTRQRMSVAQILGGGDGDDTMISQFETDPVTGERWVTIWRNPNQPGEYVRLRMAADSAVPRTRVKPDWTPEPERERALHEAAVWSGGQAAWEHADLPAGQLPDARHADLLQLDHWEDMTDRERLWTEKELVRLATERNLPLAQNWPDNSADRLRAIAERLDELDRPAAPFAEQVGLPHWDALRPADQQTALDRLKQAAYDRNVYLTNLPGQVNSAQQLRSATEWATQLDEAQKRRLAEPRPYSRPQLNEDGRQLAYQAAPIDERAYAEQAATHTRQLRKQATPLDEQALEERMALEKHVKAAAGSVSDSRQSAQALAAFDRANPSVLPAYDAQLALRKSEQDYQIARFRRDQPDPAERIKQARLDYDSWREVNALTPTERQVAQAEASRLDGLSASERSTYRADLSSRSRENALNQQLLSDAAHEDPATRQAFYQAWQSGLNDPQRLASSTSAVQQRALREQLKNAVEPLPLELELRRLQGQTLDGDLYVQALNRADQPDFFEDLQGLARPQDRLPAGLLLDQAQRRYTVEMNRLALEQKTLRHQQQQFTSLAAGRPYADAYRRALAMDALDQSLFIRRITLYENALDQSEASQNRLAEAQLRHEKLLTYQKKTARYVEAPVLNPKQLYPRIDTVTQRVKHTSLPPVPHGDGSYENELEVGLNVANKNTAVLGSCLNEQMLSKTLDERGIGGFAGQPIISTEKLVDGAQKNGEPLDHLIPDMQAYAMKTYAAGVRIPYIMRTRQPYIPEDVWLAAGFESPQYPKYDRQNDYDDVYDTFRQTVHTLEKQRDELMRAARPPRAAWEAVQQLKAEQLTRREQSGNLLERTSYELGQQFNAVHYNATLDVKAQRWTRYQPTLEEKLAKKANILNSPKDATRFKQRTEHEQDLQILQSLRRERAERDPNELGSRPGEKEALLTRIESWLDHDIDNRTRTRQEKKDILLAALVSRYQNTPDPTSRPSGDGGVWTPGRTGQEGILDLTLEALEDSGALQRPNANGLPRRPNLNIPRPPADQQVTVHAPDLNLLSSHAQQYKDSPHGQNDIQTQHAPDLVDHLRTNKQAKKNFKAWLNDHMSQWRNKPAYIREAEIPDGQKKGQKRLMVYIQSEADERRYRDAPPTTSDTYNVLVGPLGKDEQWESGPVTIAYARGKDTAELTLRRPQPISTVSAPSEAVPETSSQQLEQRALFDDLAFD